MNKNNNTNEWIPHFPLKSSEKGRGINRKIKYFIFNDVSQAYHHSIFGRCRSFVIWKKSLCRNEYTQNLLIENIWWIIFTECYIIPQCLCFKFKQGECTDERGKSWKEYYAHKLLTVIGYSETAWNALPSVAFPEVELLDSYFLQCSVFLLLLLMWLFS